MYCINCGAELKAEQKNCPYCGRAQQMVPDYNIYDEDDINIILESTKDIESKNNKAYIKKQQEQAQKEKIENVESAKKNNTKKIVVTTIVLCIILCGIGIGAKIIIDTKNNNSYEYQIKLADEAMFKDKLDTAEKYYRRALEISQDDVKARLKLADLYLEKDAQNEAVLMLNEVLDLDSENLDAYKKLYEIYEADGNIDAIINLKKGVTNEKILKIFKKYIVEVPTPNLSGGTYTDMIKLSLSADKGIEIFYTIDGKNPIIYGAVYTDPIEISEAGMHTVKFVALNSLGVYSDIASETYVLKYNAPADPEVTPNGGSFDVPTYVYITVPEGCSVYYTWDRSKPTSQSSEYVSPLLVPEGYNVLSVVIINDSTGLSSGVYRGVFEYIAEE